jgi:hypothetical protein
MFTSPTLDLTKKITGPPTQRPSPLLRFVRNGRSTKKNADFMGFNVAFYSYIYNCVYIYMYIYNYI